MSLRVESTDPARDRLKTLVLTNLQLIESELTN